jgi:hypothetical protein
MKPTMKTITLTPKQLEKKRLYHAHHDGFEAACTAMRQVFSAAQHKWIRDAINAVDHTRGEPSIIRLLRSELRAKARKA